MAKIQKLLKLLSANKDGLTFVAGVIIYHYDKELGRLLLS